ncbi:MAG TPA: peptidoglycan DD-metalloendopeptidase family protein [Caulobacteraceae bacterium]|nr:peptidoglycan DD-metalloendopeptidase family protein [Caulobacteraceae bacterium]
MVVDQLTRLRGFLERTFPERHVYVRSGGGTVKGVVLTTRHQTLAAGGASLLGLWLLVCTATVFIGAVSPSPADRAAARMQAYYERLTADRQAKLNSAMAQLSDTNGALGELARSVETRHEALALLLTEARGEPGAAQALAPAPMPALANANPLAGVRAVEQDQDRLIAQAETYAKSKADRLRLAFRLAGLDPASFSPVSDDNLGGPLIEAKDPRALAAILDVDPAFAQRIQSAATDLSDMRALSGVARSLPLGFPTLASQTHRTSGFGVRIDPFTGQRAFHPGVDFAGPMYTPVHATAPGVVSFVGQRNGYGNVVEIDHGHGLKTRFGHLAAIYVQVGQHVAIGTKLGGIGSTGRSTGPHLHYEVWVDGRLQNPERFLEAGQYVQQATQ